MADAMKLVPDMIEAADRYIKSVALNGEYALPAMFNWHEMWSAMLAASPPAREEAPAEGAGDEAIFERLRDIHRRNPSEYAECCSIIDALRNRTSEPEAGEAVSRDQVHNLLMSAVDPGEYAKSAHRFFQEDDAHGDRSRVVSRLTSLFTPPAPASADKLRVDHADIAARLNPDLFSSDVHVAGRAASPYAVSIKRNEAVAYVDRVMAAAQNEGGE